MDLTLDEQRLIAEFRKLSPTGKEELLAAAASLLRRTGAEDLEGCSSNQCAIKPRETKPEADKSDIFTE